jgi:hypothetical protein
LLVSRISRWLSTPIVVEDESDRPFRLRRVSALLLVLGWSAFFASCLLGAWAVRQGLPVYDGWGVASAAFGGQGALLNMSAERISELAQWKQAVHATAWSGAGMFVMGLFSVLGFDIRDRVPMWRAA